MELTIYQVDAFANQAFEGNPAAVIPLQNWLSDELLLNIAAENNLSETAYFVNRGDHFHLRWFTPVKEVRLCGHATLASAHVLFHHLQYLQSSIRFDVLAGRLEVKKKDDLYQMNFPSDQVQTSTYTKNQLAAILDLPILDVVKGTDDLLVRIENLSDLLQLKPDFRAIAALDIRGLIVTTSGQDTDIASRCFYPAYGIDEDPVTGSAHTLLIPYWASLLGKDQFDAVQGGKRKGYIQCQNKGKRVELSGPAVTYLKGSIFI